MEISTIFLIVLGIIYLIGFVIYGVAGIIALCRDPEIGLVCGLMASHVVFICCGSLWFISTWPLSEDNKADSSGFKRSFPRF